MYYLGFDIGGSFIKAALIKDKKIIKFEKKALPNNFDALIDLIYKTADELKDGIGETGGAGFSFPGTLDKNREIMLKSPNISYLDNQPLKRILEEKLRPLPVKIEHDVHCFLLAEKEVGLAKSMKDVFYLTLGTGIGGAWMVDGKIQTGSHGAAGEVGHEIINIGGSFDLNEFEELAANKFLQKTLGMGSIKSGKLAKQGDQKVIGTLKKLGKNLGIGIANIINTYDPEAIILSGGVSEAKNFILKGIKEGIEKFVISPEAQKTQILFSELGDFGGALGAAMLFNK